MAKKYWLGPGSLSGGDGNKNIHPDEEIPAKVLKLLLPERIKQFEENGQIGSAPKSSVHIIAARNTQKALKLSEKDKAALVKENAKLEKELEKKTAKNEKLLEELKETRTDLKELEKIKNEKQAFQALKKANFQIDELLEEIKKLKLKK